MSIAKNSTVTTIVVLLYLLASQPVSSATSSPKSRRAATPLAAVHAGDRLRFRVDRSRVITIFDFELFKGTHTDIAGSRERRQFDVIVDVATADTAGIVTLETFERVFDESSNCFDEFTPDHRIEGVSVKNRFNHTGKLLDRVVLSEDPTIVEMANRLSSFPVFDLSYMPPAWAKPGDSWTQETSSDLMQETFEYTLYPEDPCVRGRHCLMVTLDVNVFESGRRTSHGQSDIVADDSGVLVRESGDILRSGDEDSSISTRFSIERIDRPSSRPSWATDRFGTLRVVLLPWGLVWVDGYMNPNEVQTPFCVRLPAGHHTVRLKNEYLSRDETVDVVIGNSAGPSIAIFRNWCRHFASGPGCKTNDNDRLRDMMQEDLANGEIQQLLESSEP